MLLKPSNFKSFPWGSVLHKSECETIAQNVMLILSRTGDKWRKLSADEYKAERMKDGGFSNAEMQIFDQVKTYTESALGASRFCESWEQIFNNSGEPALMSAAPDLLEALQGILGLGKRDMSNPKYDSYFDAAKAAIEKATKS